jgi:hypothetical protein
MFKCINNLAPEYLCSIFNSINENCPCGLKSATSNDLQVPHPKRPCSGTFGQAVSDEKSFQSSRIPISRYP